MDLRQYHQALGLVSLVSMLPACAGRHRNGGVNSSVLRDAPSRSMKWSHIWAVSRSAVRLAGPRREVTLLSLRSTLHAPRWIPRSRRRNDGNDDRDCCAACEIHLVATSGPPPRGLRGPFVGHIRKAINFAVLAAAAISAMRRDRQSSTHARKGADWVLLGQLLLPELLPDKHRSTCSPDLLRRGLTRKAAPPGTSSST